MKISVIGAGNGGQAMAGHLSLLGHEVCLYARNKIIIEDLKDKGGILLEGKINGFGRLHKITADLKTAVIGADIIMIVTTANAHFSLAQQLADFLEEGQIIILNPGRTGGALDFKEGLLRKRCSKRIYLAEAQTLIYACRIKEVGVVNIIGIKDRVLLSAIPATDTTYILKSIVSIYPCFIPAKNVMITGLENIGAIFHPSVLLFNAASIERGGMFYFYREMTSSVGNFIEELDKERLAVGRAYGLDLISAKEWISYAYKNVEGNTLCERMQNNPAYFDIVAPTSINCRQITEDIPTGLLPIAELGKHAGLEMPLSSSIVSICSSLLNLDFRKEGRTIERLGLKQLNTSEIINKIEYD